LGFAVQLIGELNFFLWILWIQFRNVFLEMNGDQVVVSCEKGSTAESKGKGASYIQCNEGRITGVVTWRRNCLLSALLKERWKGREDEEEDVRGYWMNVTKREGTGN
jgi:hypothetical protein